MACCGPSLDRSKNGEDLLKMVRNFDDMNFPMKLKDGFNFTFEPKLGRWKENFELDKTNNYEKYNIQITNLTNIKNKKKLEIELLKKKYLERMAKLLLMAETHCKIKDNILDIFEEGIGVKKKHILEEETEEEKEFVTTLLNNEQSFENNENLNEYKNQYKKEEKIPELA